MTEQVYHYYFTIWFQGTQSAAFQVAEAAWTRFRRAMTEKRTGFFICATIDGHTLAINLDTILFAEVWNEEAAQAAEHQPNRYQEVTLYYPAETKTFTAQDPVDLANIFTILKPSQQGEALPFTTSEGKLVVFNTDELIWLKSSTVFVEEGFYQIWQEKKAKK